MTPGRREFRLAAVAATLNALVLLGALMLLPAAPIPKVDRVLRGTPSGQAPSPAVTTGGVRPGPREGTIRVPLADRLPRRFPADGTPAGWELREFSGRASIQLHRSEVGLALRLQSEQGSFVLHRDVIVDLAERPYLAWSWKVIRLPAAGDVRQRARDDQAGQVYVIFPRWPAPLARSDVIGYVWDSRAPVGTAVTSPKAANVKVIVVESGPARLGAWQHLQRNVLEDYTRLFGQPPPRVGKIALMIDANDTRSDAEAWIADLGFSRTRSKSAEIPTSMLR
ncbi:MAG: DUF3047 domain-containing protein [Candidatus Rokubacteria bacterium]|nr:DUF3047 domain-containing protein [Candidatus Rokubacteria bacterium]